MFRTLKDYLEKGAEKWDADIESFMRQRLENACGRYQRFGKDAEELRSLQEMLYVLYTTLSNCDMAKRVKRVGFDRMLGKCFDEALSKDHQERKEWEVIEEQLLDVVNAIAEVLTDDKDSFLLEFCPKCLDLVLKKQTNYLHGIEVLKGCNMILENCTLTTKEKILQRTDNANKLKGIAVKLETVGDYECQVGILECLFRIIPRKQRREYATNFFHNENILDKFMLIKDAQFETDCRIFLNEYNASISNQLVFSIPCARAVLGNKELVKPDDEDYEHFWVDFNTGTRRITLFCEQSSNSENDCDFWETISIRNEDVAEIKLQKTKITTDLEIVFEKPIRILFPSQTSVDGQHMQMHFSCDTDIEHVVEETLPDCCNVIESSQKVSTVEFPVRIQRDFSQEIPVPKPIEKNTHKASSPCTPMHLVQDNWKMGRKDSELPHTQAEQEDKKKRPVNEAAVRVSSKKGYCSSMSSKASNTASPLKISSATFYSNAHGKREHKVTTPKIPAVGKKKKVKTPVVTVTPPVKKFKTNVDAGKRESTKTLKARNGTGNKTEPKPQRLQSKSTNSTLKEKETSARSPSTKVPEDKHEIPESDIDGELLLIEMDDAVEDLQILDSKQAEKTCKIQNDIVQNMKELKLPEKDQSKLKHSGEHKNDIVLDIIGSKYSSADNHFSSKRQNVSKTDISKNPTSKKSSNVDRQFDKIETTVLPLENKREVKQNADSDVVVVEKMIQPTETDSLDSDAADDCLMTNVCIHTESDRESTRDNSQQETENQQFDKGNRSRICVEQIVPNISGIIENEKNDKKLQGRKRKHAKTCTKQQISPVVELQRLETTESYPVNKTVLTVEEEPKDKKSVQPSRKRGRPKGSKKKDAKAPPTSSKAQKNTTEKNLYALTDKTTQCFDTLPTTDTAVFEWKDDDEESNSKVIQTTCKSLPQSAVDSDHESEVDFIQESQENAKYMNDCASNKSLATDLSFKESPWYKCMPQHSKYNTKWFKTYGKVRGSQRQQTASSKDVDFRGDSPVVKKYSQQVTKTLSVQMTYSSQCVSSPGGDAGNDPYIFNDNCSEYSNNLLMNSKKNKSKQRSQKSVKTGKGRSSKKADSPEYVYKEAHTSRHKSKKVYDERQNASKKEYNLNSCDTRKQNSVSKYKHRDEENTVSLYKMENICQMEKQHSKPKTKNLVANKTTSKCKNRQKESDEDDYAISCIPSPEEAFDNGSLSGSPTESQSPHVSCMDDWKPRKDCSFLEGKNKVQKYTDDKADISSPSQSPIPRKKQKRSNRSKIMQNSDTSPANNVQPTTPESILSKFRRSCEKLVEESCCSEENVASRLQTPLLAVSPYIGRTEQNEIENEIDSSQRSEKNQSQESNESEPRCLKRKYKANEDSCLVEKDVPVVMDKGLQMNWLQRIQSAHRYKTNDDDKETMSISISTASSQDVESVVSEKISSFGVEIQNHMKAKKKQLDCMTKDVLRSLMKICSKSSRETREQRTKYIEKFQHIVLEELKAIEKDVSSLKKTEDECMLYLEEKLQQIQRYTCSQVKSIQNLVAAKELFMKEMHHCEQYADKSQLKAQNLIKKELESMKARLVSKNQQDELENIKRCLQQSFSIG